MNPLSITKYYTNSKKKFLSVVVSIALSTLLLYTVQMLLDSMFITIYDAFVEPQKYFASITTKGRLLDEELVKEVKNNASVESVIPWVFRFTNFYCNIGGNTGTKVFTVKHEDMLMLMYRLNLILKEGRLPEVGSKEIAIHYLLAKNKGLKVGDKIGSNMDKEESILGERSIVGLIDGKSIVSFDSLETWLRDNGVKNEYTRGIIIIPKDKAEQQLDRYLNSLYLTGLDVRTFSSVSIQNMRDTKNIKIIFTFISILVLVIISFCTGFLCYVYFQQRLSEFALLNAIGYSKQQVINRAFGEINGTSVIGFSTGLILSIIIGVSINLLSYAPSGQILQIWSWDYFVKVACIPIFATIFSIVPVWRMLNNLDPISVIEGGQK